MQKKQPIFTSNFLVCHVDAMWNRLIFKMQWLVYGNLNTMNKSLSLTKLITIKNYCPVYASKTNPKKYCLNVVYTWYIRTQQLRYLNI